MARTGGVIPVERDVGEQALTSLSHLLHLIHNEPQVCPRDQLSYANEIEGCLGTVHGSLT